MTTAGQRAWLAVSQAKSINTTLLQQLLRVFAEPQAILAATTKQLQQLGLSAAHIQALRHTDAAQLEKASAWLAQPNTQLITWQDATYPALLRQLADPPTVLYVRGDPAVLSLPQIAIVGSRHPTPTGSENAEEFAAELARVGMVITSGLALGIDAAAHRGALKVNGLTLAVCGTGIDQIYPAAHVPLSEAILAKGGAIVSEFPLTTPPWPGNFPQRNRLISGLSHGVLVVEAALRSGSLITARHALEQGREVYAIPGSIHNVQAKGCHALLRQGAKLVETVTDILEELPPTFAENSSGYPPLAISEAAADEDPQIRQILGCIDDAPTTVDHIIERSGLTADAVCSILLTLELQGKVQLTTAGWYCRVHRAGG
jgi:DNA processing protein